MAERLDSVYEMMATMHTSQCLRFLYRQGVNSCHVTILVTQIDPLFIKSFCEKKSVELAAASCLKH